MHVGQQAACGTAPRRLGLAIGFEDLLTFNHSGVPRFLPTLFACRAMRLRGRTNRRPCGGLALSANSDLYELSADIVGITAWCRTPALATLCAAIWALYSYSPAAS